MIEALLSFLIVTGIFFAALGIALALGAVLGPLLNTENEED